MSNLQDKKRWIVIAGICDIWYLEMSKVLTKPSGVETDIKTKELRTSSVLYPLFNEGASANYYEEPELGSNGLAIKIGLDCENIVLDADKDNQLNIMMRKRMLIVLKDNHGNYRFILNARILSKAATGAFIGGKPIYSITIEAAATIAAYHYTGNVGVDSAGYLRLF